MRKFYLQNEIGDRKSLQTRGELFFNSPMGLGFSDSNSYANANGFFTRTYREAVQGSIAGEIVVGGYAKYKELADWIFSGYELSLVYAPNGVEYMCDVDIQSLDKSELRKGVLACPVSMVQKSPWYRMAATNIVIAPPDSPIGWTRLPFSFPAQFTPSGMVSSIELHPAGHMAAAVSIDVPGPLISPVLTLKAADDSTIGLVDLSDENISSGETLRFSSRPGHIGIWRNDESLIGLIDIANNNFFRIPQNKMSRLILSASGAISTAATVRLYEYYRTV